MKIGVLFNCQGQGVSAAMRLMLPDTEVDYYPIMQSKADPAWREETFAALQRCDVVISQRMGEDKGKLATARLRHTVPQFCELPGVGFRGFHPDQIYIRAGDSTLAGPTADYHSRLAVAGFLGGLSVEDTALLYHKLAFARLGYLRTYEDDFVLLGEQFATHGLEGSAALSRMRASGCFMHTCNHPKRVPLIELARLACGKLGLPARDVAEDEIKDFLAPHPMHPVFDDIAAATGVPPEGMFRRSAMPGETPVPISLIDFVAGSFQAFQDIDRAVLRHADGVMDAMAALDLTEMAPPSSHIKWQRGMALMTWHGTLLRQAPGGALHLPLAVPDGDAALLRADLQDPTAEELAVLGGVRVRAAVQPGVLALGRGQLVLTADRDSPRGFFQRDAVGDWESFLPVTDSQLAVLRTLLEGEWARDGAASGGKAQLVGGPAVLLGTARIELAQSWPRALAAGSDGVARLAVRLDGVPAILRQTVRPVAAPAAASQKIGLGQRIVLAGDPVLLPLPLTLDDQDRAWLHAQCGDADGLPWQAAAPQAVVSREADQRMLGPLPKTGESLPQQAVLEGAKVLVAPVSGRPPESGAEGWAAPLLRLLVMAPYLEPDMQVIEPGGAAEGALLAQAWAATGLPPLPMAAAPSGLYVARDVTWLHPGAPCEWPAENLQTVRRPLLGNTAPGEARLVLRGPAWRALAAPPALAGLDFTVVDIGGETPAALMAQLRGAGWVMGVGEDLMHAAFCPAGTKVIELCDARRFVPDAWQLSCRLDMTHAVLPCEGFRVDPDRLGGLLRMLKFRI